MPQLEIFSQLDTAQNPYKGFASFPHRLRLQPGFWSGSLNIRNSAGGVKVRNGILKLTSATPGGGSAEFRGASRLVVDGTRVLVAAYLISGEVRIYRLDPDTGGWTGGVAGEMTAPATSGGLATKYGNTRLSDAWVRFAAIRDDEAGKTYIIATNGTNYPLWIDITASSTMRAAFHQPITPPTPSNLQQTLLRFATYVPVAGGSISTYTATTAARFNIANTGSSPDNYALVSIDSTVATNDSVKMAFPSSRDFRLGRQLAFLWESSFRNFWENVKVQISSDNFSTSTITVWDGSAITGDYRLVPVDTEGKKQIIAFPLDGLSGISAITHLQFVYVGQAPSVDVTLNLYGVFVTGANPGLSQYAITFRNTGSRAESFTQTMPFPTSSRLKDLGGPPLKDLRIPNSELLYYVYDVGYIKITQAMADVGVDDLIIYRKDFLGLDQSGAAVYEQRFYFETHGFVATFNAGAGTWSVSGGSPGALGTVSNLGTYGAQGRDMSRFSPSDGHVPMPKTYSVSSLGDRLVCGNVNDGTARPGDVWISESTKPWRFNLGLRFINDDLSQPDPYSPTRHTFSGETVRDLLRLSGPLSGPQSMAIFTDQRIWGIGGVSALELSYETPLSKTGLAATGVLHETRNAVYFVNDQVQLCQMIGTQITPISKQIVEDKLRPATVDHSSISSQNDLVYLAYKPSGQSTYNRAFVFDEYLNIYHGEDSPASNSEFAQMVTDGNRTLYFGSDGHVWVHDLAGQSTDNGTNITWSMISAWFRPKFNKQFAVKRAGVKTTDVTSGTISCLIDYHPGTGAGPTFSFSIDVSQDYSWKIDSQDASSTDVRGNFAGATWAGSATAGTEILDLWLECEERVSGQSA